MTKAELKETVLQTLSMIAPEADLAQLKPLVNLRDQLDIDSMDFLNFIIALDHKLGLAVPEADYAKLASLDGCVEYLWARQSRQC